MTVLTTMIGLLPMMLSSLMSVGGKAMEADPPRSGRPPRVLIWGRGGSG